MFETLIPRRKFIGLLGGFLTFFSLSSCKKKSEEEAHSTIIKLTEVKNLKEGANHFPLERLVVVKRGADLKAMSIVCTHQECLLRPQDGTGAGYICPCHGATFNSDGKVLSGPATKDLRQFPVSIDTDGNLLVQISFSS